MATHRLFGAVLVACTLAMMACNSGGSMTSPAPTSTRRVTPTETAETAMPNEKQTPTEATATAVETPGATPTTAVETPGATPTPVPPATEGTPAPLIQNVSAFFTQFQTPPQDEVPCAYIASVRVIYCPNRGLYAPNPPPVGQGIDCFLMTVDLQPVAIRCEIASPQGTDYYDIRRGV